MATHREDLSRLSLSMLARLTGRAPATIRERLEGLAPVAMDGRTRWYESQAALSRIYCGGDGLDLNAERARLAKEQADAQEMKNAQLRGELLPAGSIESFLVRLFSGVRMRILAVPAKAAPEAHAAENIAATESIVRRYLVEALESLADAEARASRGDSARELAAAAADDDARVGGGETGGPDRDEPGARTVAQ